jgi:hypothetical protein
VSVIPAIILVIALTVYAGSITVMLIGFIGVLIAYSLLSRHIKSISPKFKKVTAKEVVIEAPLQGDLCFPGDRRNESRMERTRSVIASSTGKCDTAFRHRPF